MHLHVHATYKKLTILGKQQLQKVIIITIKI